MGSRLNQYWHSVRLARECPERSRHRLLLPGQDRLAVTSSPLSIRKSPPSLLHRHLTTSQVDTSNRFRSAGSTPQVHWIGSTWPSTSVHHGGNFSDDATADRCRLVSPAPFQRSPKQQRWHHYQWKKGTRLWLRNIFSVQVVGNAQDSDTRWTHSIRWVQASKTKLSEAMRIRSYLYDIFIRRF